MNREKQRGGNADGADQLPDVIYTDDAPAAAGELMVSERELVHMDAQAPHPAELDPRGFLAADYAAVLDAMASGADLDALELPSERRMQEEEERARNAAAQEHGQQRDPAAHKEYMFLDHRVKCEECARNAANAELARRQRDGLKAAQRDALLLMAGARAHVAQLAATKAAPLSISTPEAGAAGIDGRFEDWARGEGYSLAYVQKEGEKIYHCKATRHAFKGWAAAQPQATDNIRSYFAGDADNGK